jgi:ATP-binding cassette subfamily C exporter for protease/lipase
MASTTLRKHVAALRPYFVRATLFSLVSALLILAPSAYMLEVYGRVVDSRSHMTLAMLTVAVVGAYALMEVMDWARHEIMQDAGLAFDKDLRSRIFHSMFDASVRRLPGAGAQSLADLRSLREFLASPPLLALMEAPVSVVCLVLIFAMSPVLGWSALVGALIHVTVAWLNERSTRPPLIAANLRSIVAEQYALNTQRHAQVVESMGMLGAIHQRWFALQQEFLQLQAQASGRAGLYQATGKFFQITMGSALLGLGAWLLLHEALNGGAGMVIVGSILGGRVTAPVVQMVAQWRWVVGAHDAYQRLANALESLPPQPATMPLPVPKGVVQVDKVIATAPGGNVPLLKGVDFTLVPGDVLAVVGPSAAGKTTLARLLVGVWPAASGKVRLDGADLFAWNKAEVGPFIGYVPQVVELFDGTVAENIARFGAVDMRKVHAAAQTAGVHDWIMSLPSGYDTTIDHSGGFLSGGQRQQIALARAYYGAPVFIVMDEPNANLDEAGEVALASAIQSLSRQGTTFVVMTHRTNVLSVAGKMLILKEGVVHALGRRDEVLAALHQSRQQTANLPSS